MTTETFSQPCPKCKEGVVSYVEKLNAVLCSNGKKCGFSVFANQRGKELSKENMIDLATGKKIGPFADLKNKEGKTYAAELKMDDAFKVIPVFAPKS